MIPTSPMAYEIVCNLTFSSRWGFWGRIMSQLPIQVKSTKNVIPGMTPRGYITWDKTFRSPLIVLSTEYDTSISDWAFVLTHETEHFILDHGLRSQGIADRRLKNIADDVWLNCDIRATMFRDSSGTIKDIMTLLHGGCYCDLLFHAGHFKDARYDREIAAAEKALGRPMDRKEKLKHTIDIHDPNTSWMHEYDKHVQAMSSEEIYEILKEHPEISEAFGGGDDPDGHVIGMDDMDLTEEEKQAIIKELVKNAAAAGMGNMPLRVEQTLKGFRPPTIRWNLPFRAFINGTRRLNRNSTWMKENSGGDRALPGARRTGSHSIGLVTDVSGSVGDDELIQIYNEYIRLEKDNVQLWEVQVDTESCGGIQRLYPSKVRRSGVTRKGYGGTDMNPGIKIAMEDPRAGIVVLFTDGYIPPIDKSLIVKPFLVVITGSGSTSEVTQYKHIKM